MPNRCALCNAELVNDVWLVQLASSGDVVPTCIDLPSCFARWHEKASQQLTSRVRKFLAELVSNNDSKRLGRCSRCWYPVYQAHDRVTQVVVGTEVYYHYSCFVELLSEKVRSTLQ